MVVITTPAITRDAPVYLTEIGKASAMESVSIVPQVGGKVTAVHFEDGASVKKGQLLFEIDPRPFSAALAAAKATLAQSKAELDWAQTEFKWVQGLRIADSASQLEYDQKRTAFDVAQAKADAADAAVQTATLNLEYASIHSPIDGRAGARHVDPGNVVNANAPTVAPMLLIHRLDPIYVEFTVTEKDFATVRAYFAMNNTGKEGLRVEVDVPTNPALLLPLGGASATQPAGRPGTAPSGPREGELTFLDNAVQSATGTVKIRATVPNADRRFWPGQFVNVRLVLTIKKDAVLIPAEAQQVGQQGPYVYVVRQDGTAELRPIIPGQKQGEMVVVESGLQPGEQVIVTGQMMVMPGGKVMVANAAPASQPGASGPAPATAK